MGEEELRNSLADGNSLYLRGCTGLTSLPDGLTVGGGLYLSGCTGLTSLPDGLTVGGNLYLVGCTGLTSLPDGLTVGGYLDLGGCTGMKHKHCEIKKVRKLKDGDYKPGRYLYADGILTHIKKRRMIGDYTLFVGKIPGNNVVSDGVHYAHCDKLRDGIADLLFKSAKDRGADQYKGLSLDTELTVAEAVTMYRVITGACRQGSQSFVDRLKEEGKLKERYTIRECVEVTRGKYNAERFSEFFGM